MRPFIFSAIISAILGLLIWYNIGAIRAAFSAYAPWVKKLAVLFYIVSHLVLIAGLVYLVFTTDQKSGSSAYMPWFGYLVLLLIPDLLLSVFLLGEDFFRLIIWGYNKLSGQNDLAMPERRKFISQLALASAAIPFTSIAYGLIKGKYNYKIKKVELAFADLPKAFDGLTITQISDLHTGSFDNKTQVEHGVELVNGLKSDLIFFTGDLVNNKASEAEPWIDVFKKCTAPMGKFSVLGNHDYGDYIPWDSPEEKSKNLDRLKSIHGEMGFKLLLNENVDLHQNGESISICGVENWGKPPFVQYGDLEKALENSSNFRLMLSHDPSHFDEQIKHHQKKVHLTMAGHTHGMQFGIDIPGFKWSPVKWKYPKWSGLYTEVEKHLYVNQGFGFLAFPGRVGMWPEITQITLKSA
jgi:predicted MPP superfamily phosphohydrolase